MHTRPPALPLPHRSVGAPMAPPQPPCPTDAAGRPERARARAWRGCAMSWQQLAGEFPFDQFAEQCMQCRGCFGFVFAASIASKVRRRGSLSSSLGARDTRSTHDRRSLISSPSGRGFGEMKVIEIDSAPCPWSRRAS